MMFLKAVTKTQVFLTGYSGEPRRDELPMNQPADEDEANTAKSVRRHGHQLRFSRARHSQLIDDCGQNSANSPASDRMADPKESECGERRIFDQLPRLTPIPCLRGRAGLSGR